MYKGFMHYCSDLLKHFIPYSTPQGETVHKSLYSVVQSDNAVSVSKQASVAK